MHDVIVIGGGPAGTTSATLLARDGFRVLLLERERFPRFQIGESLLPYNNDIFARLGVTESLVEGEYFPKYGATFVTGDGNVGYSFRFDRTLREPYTRSFQVKRADFDHMLLRNAVKHGVDVREGTAVASVDLSDADRARVKTTGGEEHEARFVIDASGHGAVLGKSVGEKSDIESLKKIAIFAHYDNVERAPGREAGNTVIAVLQNAWFWLIPVTATTMSVGLVVDRDHVMNCGLSPEMLLEKTIAATPYVAKAMRNATRTTQVYTRKDFSFRMRHLAGTNYALAGDAAGFLDPIFSTGVFMAMKSADIVASGVSQRLKGGSMRALKTYERDMTTALAKYLRFIEFFYQRDFLEVFMQPSERFGLLTPIVGVLAGNIFAKRGNRFKLALFFFLVRMQKWRGGIAPRIAWETLPPAASA
ncbi:MAG TPA: NAD(P)/FAD-dependent oxidoreductase [Thermoanaerobaculia bacterium]|nr:NAD(P)/FAD-dependent oxidoreductase [Thermoanaerobaculia bacterium]